MFWIIIEANHLLKEDKEMRNKVNNILSNVNREFKGKLR